MTPKVTMVTKYEVEEEGEQYGLSALPQLIHQRLPVLYLNTVRLETHYMWYRWRAHMHI